MDSFFFLQSITDVFGGRSRDRGSSGDRAVRDIGSAFETERSDLMLFWTLMLEGVPGIVNPSPLRANKGGGISCRVADGDCRAVSCWRNFVQQICGDHSTRSRCNSAPASRSRSGLDRLHRRPGPCMPRRPIAETRRYPFSGQAFRNRTKSSSIRDSWASNCAGWPSPSIYLSAGAAMGNIGHKAAAKSSSLGWVGVM